MKIVKVAAVLVVATVATAVADRASACSAPPCRESWSAPDTSKTVPANAPALVFVQGTAPIGAMAMAGPPSLKNAAGPIAFTRDGDFLRPAAPLPVGEVTLEWDETCSYPPPDGGIERKSLSFGVVAATPLPTALGTATLSYARENVDVWTSSGSCTDKLDASVARFAFDLDPALQKFRDVARFVTRVDGKDWGSSAWGREGPVAKPSFYGGALGAHRHDLVFAGCGPSPLGVTDRGVSVGKHTVEIRAEVAGTAALSAATFEIDLRCDGMLPDGGSTTPDAAPPDTSAADASALDGSTSDASGSSNESVASGGGCSTTRATSVHVPVAVFLLAAGLRRRRRR